MRLITIVTTFCGVKDKGNVKGFAVQIKLMLQDEKLKVKIATSFSTLLNEKYSLLILGAVICSVLVFLVIG